MLLLGAGASVDAGVPASRDMWREIVSGLRAKPETERYARVLLFAAGGLAFREGIRGSDPVEGIDVESVFNAVHMLAERDVLDIAPFVGSWHRSVEEIDREAAEPALRQLHEKLHRSIAGSMTHAVGNIGRTAGGALRRGDIDRAVEHKLRAGTEAFHGGEVGKAVAAFVAEMFDAWCKSVQYRPSDGAAFGDDMSRILLGVQPRGGGSRLFADTATAMITSLIDLVWIT